VSLVSVYIPPNNYNLFFITEIEQSLPNVLTTKIKNLQDNIPPNNYKIFFIKFFNKNNVRFK